MLVVEAANRRQRARGLAFRAAPGPGVALHIPHCRSVHTFGMRFALDLVWLDAAGRPVRVDRDVAPRRLRTCRDARSVLECPAGQVAALVAAQAWRMAELTGL